MVVGESRLEAGRVAVERCGASAVVLDDGFQHRTLHKDLEILAVNGRTPWGNGRLFPRGMLREPLSALRRADLLVVTNALDDAVRAAAVDVIRAHNRSAPVAAASYRVIESREPATGRCLGPEALGGRRLLAFAGLGSPRSFGDTLRGAGADVAALAEYPDHYWFTSRDLDDLARQSRELGAEGLVTTEKDWMRLKSLPPPPVPLWVLKVRLRVEDGREWLLQALERVLAPSPVRR